jgi:hypothetical protein
VILHQPGDIRVIFQHENCLTQTFPRFCALQATASLPVSQPSPL